MKDRYSIEDKNPCSVNFCRLKYLIVSFVSSLRMCDVENAFILKISEVPISDWSSTATFGFLFLHRNLLKVVFFFFCRTEGALWASRTSSTRTRTIRGRGQRRSKKTAIKFHPIPHFAPSLNFSPLAFYLLLRDRRTWRIASQATASPPAICVPGRYSNTPNRRLIQQVRRI